MSRPPTSFATLQFLGAAGTVTGSKFLIETARRQVLLDCGLFHGFKEFRLRNWRPPGFDPRGLDAVVLSHAHIDHSGYLPLVARQGFRGPVWCTSGTADLLHILLPDAAFLQEEEAALANRYGYSKHQPALPLYTIEDAKAALQLVRRRPYEKLFKVTEGIAAMFRRAGHILGASTVELQLGERKPFQLVYSGDLGRWNQPILRDPEPVIQADLLLIESTYGNKTHAADPLSMLARIVKEAVKRGGVMVVPAFAVGRTQELVWMLRELEEARRIPSLPVYVDSPMAINVAELYCRHTEDHDLDMTRLMEAHRSPLCSHSYHLVKTPEESKALNRIKGPAIIISASGMATGGRVIHHLKLRLPDPKTTVLLAGFQAAGTRGRALQDGAKQIRIHGQNVPVRATVEVLEGVSGHADRGEILQWLSHFARPPRHTYVVHGEPEAAEGLAEAIRARFRWTVHVARDGEVVPLYH